MIILKYARILSKTLVIMFMIALLFIVSAGTSTSYAHVHQAAIPASDTSHCVNTHNVNYSISCSAPAMTTYCSGQQYFPATDGYGNALDWTYTDQNNLCVNVTYTLRHSFYSCDVDFYVPNADSSATFTYTWFDGSYHTGTLNENPVDGWQPLFTASSATWLSFTDHDTPGSLRLGWGSSATDGVRVTCS
jgi:hypothetical protein